MGDRHNSESWKPGHGSAVLGAIYVFIACGISTLCITNVLGALIAPTNEPFRDVAVLIDNAVWLTFVLGLLFSPFAVFVALITLAFGRRLDSRVATLQWSRWYLKAIAPPLALLSLSISSFLLSRFALIDADFPLPLANEQLREQYSTLLLILSAMLLLTCAAFALRACNIQLPELDWSKTNHCGRCGYDRGESVSVCPECGEDASVD